MKAPARLPVMGRAGRRAIAHAFASTTPHRTAFEGAAAGLFMDRKGAGRFEAFVGAPGFPKLARRLQGLSPRRCATLCDILFQRLRSGDDPAGVAEAGAVVASKRFRSAMGVYRGSPEGREESLRVTEIFVELYAKDRQLGEGFLDLLASPEFAILRRDCMGRGDLGNTMVHMLVGVLEARGLDMARAAAHMLGEDEAFMLILMGDAVGLRKMVLSSLAHVFTRHPDPGLFFRMLAMFSRHYRPSHLGARETMKACLGRLADLWRVFWRADAGSMTLIDRFIGTFGHGMKGNERYAWDQVLDTEPAIALEAMEVMTSRPFQDLRNRFAADPAVVRNFVRLVMGALSRGAGNARGAMVKAILAGRMDRDSLRRRAEFMEWLMARPGSACVTGTVGEYLLHECIAVTLADMKGEDRAVSNYRDGGHRLFCAILDGVYPRASSHREMIFMNIDRNVRNGLWAGVKETFPREAAEMADIRAISEMAGIEDRVLEALKTMDPGDLKGYHDNLLFTWLDTPGSVLRASAPDDWHRVTFAEAAPYCLQTIVPLVGMIGVRASGNGTAYTNGKVILLPSQLSLFKDPRNPIERNRNLAAYIALSLHEAGHILGGSYHFNVSDYINGLERPELFLSIHNALEDFRVESLIMKIKAHPQACELFYSYHRHMTKMLGEHSLPEGSRFLLYIADTAGGYNSDLLGDPGYRDTIDALMNSGLPAGKFGTLRAMAEYGVESLRGFDVAFPLSSFALAEELYDIMKHWSEDALAFMSETIMLSAPGASGGGGDVEARPLTREELDELYRLFNRNPVSFLKRHGLRVFPSLLRTGGGGDSNGEDKGVGGRVDTEDARNPGVEPFVPDYSRKLTMDDSTRTLIDDESAAAQLEEIPDDVAAEIVEYRKSIRRSRSSGHDTPGESANGKGERPHGLDRDPSSRSYTNLKEVREYVVRRVNPSFMARFRQWEPIISRVHEEMSRLLPALDDEPEIAADEGDLDPDQLVEVMSDRDNRPESPDLFETTRDGPRRSLEVAIGLDASGSTADRVGEDGTTILDIEKAFSIILGRALKLITPDVNVFAFNSIATTNVYRAVNLNAVSGFRADEGNRDGDFIRYLTFLLKKSTADMRFLFLLSDGKPNAFNYQGSEALEDTLLAMRETVNEGIKLVYYNCDRERGEYFDMFRKEATFARHFTDPRQMLPSIPEMLRSIVRSM